MEIKLPGIDYAAIAPMLIMFGVACAGVLVEDWCPGGRATAYSWCSRSSVSSPRWSCW